MMLLQILNSVLVALIGHELSCFDIDANAPVAA